MSVDLYRSGRVVVESTVALPGNTFTYTYSHRCSCISGRRQMDLGDNSLRFLLPFCFASHSLRTRHVPLPLRSRLRTHPEHGSRLGARQQTKPAESSSESPPRASPPAEQEIGLRRFHFATSLCLGLHRQALLPQGKSLQVCTPAAQSRTKTRSQRRGRGAEREKTAS